MHVSLFFDAASCLLRGDDDAGNQFRMEFHRSFRHTDCAAHSVYSGQPLSAWLDSLVPCVDRPHELTGDEADVHCPPVIIHGD